MLIDENDSGTKDIDIHACNILLPVHITNSQLKVDNIIDLGSSMTSRIVIWAVYVVISMECAREDAFDPLTDIV
jgi:hypothetical protein